MNLSFLLIVFWIMILLCGMLCSRNHLFKISLCLLISLSLTLIYLYLEKRFSNLTSLTKMEDFFIDKFAKFYQNRGLTLEERRKVSLTFWILVINVVLFIIAYFSLSFVPFGRVTDGKYHFFRRLVPYLIYVSGLGYAFLFFIDGFSPFVSMPFGFLESFSKLIGWEALIL